MWGALEAKGEKHVLTQRRNESIDKAYQQAEASRQARLTRQQQEDK